MNVVATWLIGSLFFALAAQAEIVTISKDDANFFELKKRFACYTEPSGVTLVKIRTMFSDSVTGELFRGDALEARLSRIRKQLRTARGSKKALRKSYSTYKTLLDLFKLCQKKVADSPQGSPPGEEEPNGGAPTGDSPDSGFPEATPTPTPTPVPPANSLPVASAGVDALVIDSDGDRSQLVTLNASASSDLNGTIVNFRWREGETELASGSNPIQSVVLGIGVHTIDLTVTDNLGGTGSDQIIVTVDFRRASTVSQHGITWTFDKPYRVGTFVTGDWWVVPDESEAVVKLVDIDPAPQEVFQDVIYAGGAADYFKINGTMLNPSNSDKQGFDSRVNAFSAALYLPAPSVSSPATIPSNTSIVSTISWQASDANHPAPYGGAMKNAFRPSIRVAAVVTVLEEPPPTDAFRPPYSGSSKPIYRASTLNMGELPRLSSDPVKSTLPSLATADQWVEKVWLDNMTNWAMDALHPSENLPNYGRDLSARINDVVLMSLLDLPESDLTALARRITQIGIDNFGVLNTGGRWGTLGGGIGVGRKLPILFAGLLLDHAGMRAVGTDYDLDAFQEDCQTFNVTQEYLDQNAGKSYIADWQVGDARWGARHCNQPQNDDLYRSYMTCCTANSWHGAVLSARYLGLKNDWKHSPLFEYTDWYMTQYARGDVKRSWTDFSESMWDTYRADAP